MKFNYQARTEKGEIRAGVVEASSKEAAMNLLQKQGLYITYLEEEKVPFYAKSLQLGGISSRDIVLFSRQIAMMFDAKISLVEALRVLASQSKNSKLQDKVLDIAVEVEGGSPFSKAISRHPEIFSTLYVAMVKAGEESGKLSESLDYLAEHLEREYELMSKTRGALIYPALVLALGVVVVFLIVNTVVPQLEILLKETNAKVPAFTQTVLDVSRVIREQGVLLLGGFALFCFLAYRFSKTKTGQKFFDSLFLRIPIVSPVLKTLYLSRLAESLSTLISGGLMLGQALDLSADIVGNTLYKKSVLTIRDEVRRGTPISSVLTRYPHLYPPLFIQMTLVGERTGGLDTSLMQVAQFYQGEVERGINNILDILEPALIILLGGGTGGLIFSILVPLYQSMSI